MSRFLVGQTGKREEVVLRPICKEDTALFYRWINDQEIRQNLAPLFPLTELAEEKWVEGMMSQGNPPANIVLVICLKNDPIGAAGFHDIDYIHRFATTGMYIGEKNLRGQGIGSCVKRMMMQYAFGELNLRTLRTEVYGHNQASCRMQEKCGWREVGRFPNLFRKGGEGWTDLVQFAITQEEWRAQEK